MLKRILTYCLTALFAVSFNAYGQGTSASLFITNSATADYENTVSVFSAASNSVMTDVAEVYNVNIVPDGTAASPGRQIFGNPLQTVSIAYDIVNLANTSDTFTLNVINLGADLSDLQNIEIHIDSNRNGLYDFGEPLYDNAAPPLIDENTNLSIVVAGQIPFLAGSGSIFIDINATSVSDNTKADNGDNVTEIIIPAEAFLSATITSGKATVPPGGTYTLTLDLRNNGFIATNGVDIQIDTDNDNVTETYRGAISQFDIPANVTYVPNSVTASSNNIYGIYKGAAGIWRTNSSDVVGPILSIAFVVPEEGGGETLQAGQTIIVSADLLVGSLATGDISNIEQVSYSNASGNVSLITNEVLIAVLPPTPANIAVDDTDDFGVSTGSGIYPDADDTMSISTTIEAGETAVFVNEVWNLSASNDVIDLTHDTLNSQNIPVGTIVRFYTLSGTTLLTDSDSDGVPDTGLLQPGEKVTFITKITYPEDSVTSNVVAAVLGTSSLDTNVSDLTFNEALVSQKIYPIKTTKKGSASSLYIGDVMKFTVTVTNPNELVPVYNLSIKDIMPRDIRYMETSGTINTVEQEPTISKQGNILTWNIPILLPLETLTLTYLARANAGASEGRKLNTAIAEGYFDPGNLIYAKSNQANYYFKIKRGMFTDKAFITGKVFVDTNDNRMQDEGEIGVKGIKLYLEDGRSVVTDGDGKYHMDQVLAGTHTLKVDDSTLPAGYNLKIINSRNVGDPSSQFVDVVSGEHFKANFRLAPPSTDAQMETKEEIVAGGITGKRIIETILTDPTTGKTLLQHDVRVENTSTNLTVYEIRYFEDSAFEPLPGTSTLDGAPLRDPEKTDDGFKWEIPLLEPKEEVTIRYNTVVPKKAMEVKARLLLKTKPAGEDIVKDIAIPISFTEPMKDSFEVEVNFDFGKYTLSRDAKTSLDKIVSALREIDYDHLYVRIKAHTDAVAFNGKRKKSEKDAVESNLALSKKRSLSVVTYLKEKLIDIRKLKVIEGDLKDYEELIGEEGRIVDEEVSKDFYTVKLFESDNKDDFKETIRKYNNAGIKTAIEEKIFGFKERKFILYIGYFENKDEAQALADSMDEGIKEVAIIERHTDGVDKSEKGSVVYHVEAKGSLEPKVENKMAQGGTKENRRAEINVVPLTKQTYTQDISISAALKQGLYKLSIKSSSLMPGDDYNSVKLYLALPKGTGFIQGSAFANEENVTVTKKGKFYVVEMPNLKGDEPFELSLNILIKEGTIIEDTKYTMFAKNSSDKVIKLLSNNSEDNDRLAFYDFTKDEGKEVKKDIKPQILYPPRDMMQTEKQTDVMVLVPSNFIYEVLVNNVQISEERIGKKTIDKKNKAKTLSYISVPLDKPENIITLKVKGQIVDKKVIRLTGEVDELELDISPARPINDGISPVYVVIDLKDKEGNKVIENAFIEVKVDRGDVWDNETKKYNPAAQDYFKVRATAGRAVIKLSPTNVTETRLVQVKYGNLEKEIEVKFYPQIRPWIVVGNIETGMGRSDNRNNPPSKENAPYDHSEKGTHSYAEGKVFAKGSVKDYSITAKYSTDTRDKENIMQSNQLSIEENGLYPSYGDSSTQFFEAKSQRNYYLKIEKDLNSLTVGDFNTSLGRGLEFNRYERTINGALLNIEENKNYKFRSFVAENDQIIVSDEIKGTGLSGPYAITRSDMIINSEKIWIETRDRYNENIVLGKRQLTRYIDYSIDFDSGYLFFTEPISEFDDALNPLYIHAIYESREVGVNNYMYGLRGEKYLLDDSLKIGTTATVEEHDIRDKELFGVDVKYKKGKLKGSAEFSTTRSFNESTLEDSSGAAGKINLSYSGNKKQAAFYYKKVNDGYQNLSAAKATEAYETVGVKGQLSLFNNHTTIKGDANITENNVKRKRIETFLNQKITNKFSLLGGLRHNDEHSKNENTTSNQAIYGFTYRPFKVFSLDLKREENISSGNDGTMYPTRTVARARLKLHKTTEAFVQSEIHERADKDLTLTTFGINSKITKNTSAYTKYSIEDSVSGVRGLSHTGLAHKLTLMEGLTFDIGGELVKTVSSKGDSSGDYKTIRLGLSYLAKDKFKASTKYEQKFGKNSNDSLYSLSLMTKLNREFTLMLTERYYDSTIIKNDINLGISYRPTYTDKVNYMAKLRHIAQKSKSLDENKLIASGHINYRPVSHFTFDGMVAVKSNKVKETNNSKANMFRGKIIYDLNEHLDFNVHGSYLFENSTNSYSKSYGMELGAKLYQNIWFSVGYNFDGYYDDDFSDARYWSKGTYMKLRIKFDEKVLKKFGGIFEIN